MLSSVPGDGEQVFSFDEYPSLQKSRSASSALGHAAAFRDFGALLLQCTGRFTSDVRMLDTGHHSAKTSHGPTPKIILQAGLLDSIP